MTPSRITARLEYDVKHLIWRAQVHGLASDEIYQRFEQIRREYLQISTVSERGLLLNKLDEWEVALAGHNRREGRPSSALTG